MVNANLTNLTFDAESEAEDYGLSTFAYTEDTEETGDNLVMLHIDESQELNNAETASTNDLDEKMSIAVIGIGGGGNNAINYLYELAAKGQYTFTDKDNIEHYVLNTDQTALENSSCKNHILLGKNLLNGRGAGLNITKGLKATNESAEEIKKAVRGKHVVIVTAGLGGGTGTLGISKVADIAKQEGAIVIAFVTTPFSFEGASTVKKAQVGFQTLEKYTDASVVFKNDNVAKLKIDSTIEVYRQASKGLVESIVTLMEVVNGSHTISIDFNDLKTLLQHKGQIKFLRKEYNFKWFRDSFRRQHPNGLDSSKDESYFKDEKYTSNQFIITPEMIDEIITDLNDTPLTSSRKISSNSNYLCVCATSEHIPYQVFKTVQDKISQQHQAEDFSDSFDYLSLDGSDDLSLDINAVLDDEFDINEQFDFGGPRKITPAQCEDDEPVIRFRMIVKLPNDLNEEEKEKQKQLAQQRNKANNLSIPTASNSANYYAPAEEKAPAYGSSVNDRSHHNPNLNQGNGSLASNADHNSNLNHNSQGSNLNNHHGYESTPQYAFNKIPTKVAFPGTTVLKPTLDDDLDSDFED